MSSLEAGIGVGRTSARAAVSAPPWVWVAATAGIVFLAVTYCRSQKEDIPDYLDPNQPPLHATPDYSTSLLGTFATVPGQPLGVQKPPVRYIWDSLMQSPCCWVGDC